MWKSLSPTESTHSGVLELRSTVRNYLVSMTYFCKNRNFSTHIKIR